MARTSFAFTGAQTDATVVSAPSAGSIRVLRFMFTVSSAATVSFTDGNDATGTRFIYGDFPANGGVVLDSYGGQPNPYPIVTLTALTALKVTSSAGNIKGTIEYVVV